VVERRRRCRLKGGCSHEWLPHRLPLGFSFPFQALAIHNAHLVPTRGQFLVRQGQIALPQQDDSSARLAFPSQHFLRRKQGHLRERFVVEWHSLCLVD
jgi:hypothetical protein